MYFLLKDISFNKKIFTLINKSNILDFVENDFKNELR